VTGEPVDVVSMSGGVVVATDTTWEIGSYLRGGKYVKIFDVMNLKLFYYSHLNVVTVKPGDVVKPGEKIAEVGRTGRSAILQPGRTHLHIALLSYEKGYPKPEKIFEEIKRVENKSPSVK
jgi:murein DD-endopeptidase MepM/ murein hydrolase activator NlpD